MTNKTWADDRVDPEIYEPAETGQPSADLTRRDFVQVLGAGLLITAGGEIALGQRKGGRGGGVGGPRGPARLAARLHIDRDGSITVMTGKVEAGQGSRAEITQAAAEELRLDAGSYRIVGAWNGDAVVHAEPFEVLGIALTELWTV